jgi:hypothetical protein
MSPEEMRQTFLASNDFLRPIGGDRRWEIVEVRERDAFESQFDNWLSEFQHRREVEPEKREQVEI